jgi:hypothetical protein
MYVAVGLAWCRLLTREQRRKRPLGPFVLGRDFARSVADSRLDGLAVASVCARLACRHTWQRDAGEALPISAPPRDALDPAAAWWRPLGSLDGPGVHYVELGTGTVEFLTIAHRNDRPDLRLPR